VKEDVMPVIVEMIDTVLNHTEDEKVIADVRARVNQLMANYPIFAY
jgi:glycine hydroxymethyltransferase